MDDPKLYGRMGTIVLLDSEFEWFEFSSKVVFDPDEMHPEIGPGANVMV